jgi:hypothetical protein
LFWLVISSGSAGATAAGCAHRRLLRQVGEAMCSQSAGEKCFVDTRESYGRSISVTGNTFNRCGAHLSIPPKRHGTRMNQISHGYRKICMPPRREPISGWLLKEEGIRAAILLPIRPREARGYLCRPKLHRLNTPVKHKDVKAQRPHSVFAPLYLVFEICSFTNRCVRNGRLKSAFR